MSEPVSNTYKLEQRLIDANALIEKLDKMCKSGNGKCAEYIWNRGIKGVLSDAPTVEATPVVHCGECIWWQDRQVQLADGGCRDYMPDEPWSVTSDIGINVGAHCTKHGFEDKSGSWFWANANDFCSRGERREGKP